jgi:hypothetical protein
MAPSTGNDDTKTANTAVKNEGDHDRVAMLSLQADGTPDQHNPEIIGDKDAAIKATKVQFAQQAVSAVDAEKRAELGLAAQRRRGHLRRRDRRSRPSTTRSPRRPRSGREGRQRPAPGLTPAHPS